MRGWIFTWVSVLGGCSVYGPTGEIGVELDGGMPVGMVDGGGMEMPMPMPMPMTGDPGPVMDVPRDPACPAGAAWVTRVRGAIVDEMSAPIPGVKAQACIRVAVDNTLVCLRPADSDVTGQFVIDLPADVRCSAETTMRLVLPNSTRAVSYCPLGAPAAGSEIRMGAPLRMYGAQAAVELPPLGDATRRRTVRFENGLELQLVPQDFFADYVDLAATRISSRAGGLCFLENEAPFDAIYAFSPEGASSSAIALRLPNSTNIPPGRRVRTYFLGALGCLDENNEQLAEGRWHELEQAVVSTDGSFIEINPGTTCLSWIAYRAE